MGEKYEGEAVDEKAVNESLGTLSLIAYLLGTSLTVWSFFPEFYFVAATLHLVIVFVAGFGVDKFHYEVWWRGCLLGVVLSLGILLSSSYAAGGLYFGLGWYVIFMSLFHYLEYLVTALTNPLNLSTDSFLLNHSMAYGLAAAASLVEYFLELYFCPGMKQWLAVSAVGAVGCAAGDTLRKLAMFHAGANFNHIVQSYKQDDHQLVTQGVFAHVRHPSYVGWFYWSICTQLILCNPFCLMAYTAVSWKFFSERIYMEEYTLLNFFGEQYRKYQCQVPTGLPFIRGFQVTVHDNNAADDKANDKEA